MLSEFSDCSLSDLWPTLLERWKLTALDNLGPNERTDEDQLLSEPKKTDVPKGQTLTLTNQILRIKISILFFSYSGEIWVNKSIVHIISYFQKNVWFLEAFKSAKDQ